MGKVGIIAGSGILPSMMAQTLSTKNEVFIACLENYADKAPYNQYNHETFAIGHVGKIFSYFESNNVQDLLIIGAIKRPSLKDINVDMKGASLIAKIVASKFLGDNEVLKVVAKFVESNGFNIKSPLDYIHNDGVTTKLRPTDTDLGSIAYGANAAEELGKLDIGQSVIVENSLILGVEAAEGTEELIKRCSNYQKESSKAILVKRCKPGQDMRLDVPVIGPDTISQAHAAGMAGIAISKDSVIVLDPETTISKADELGLFVHLF